MYYLVLQLRAENLDNKTDGNIINMTPSNPRTISSIFSHLVANSLLKRNQKKALFYSRWSLYTFISTPTSAAAPVSIPSREVQRYPG